LKRFATCIAADGQVFALGNGGSAANASHFARGPRQGASDKLQAAASECFPSRTTRPWITALGNDYRYEDIFLRQLHELRPSVTW
jgi:D-sedoheptulose 7-phosphate isomerase